MLYFTKQGQQAGLLDRLDRLGERIFINAFSDTFHKDIPDVEIERWLDAFARLPDHQFQVLTKRTERMAKFFETHSCPENVWLGVSVENQDYLWRIDCLRRVNGCNVKFISFEPLLGPIEKPDLTGINWIIIGGESDYKKPRPMEPEWVQGLINYTKVNYPDCAVFFKQMGGIGGDGAGGDVLNGRTYKELPAWHRRQTRMKEFTYPSLYRMSQGEGENRR
jgi:protein gp37